MSADGSRLEAAFDGKLGGFELNAAFDVPGTGVTGLFGPSGCGKTTILRCVAGLQRLPGRLTVEGETWQDDAQGIFRKAHERPIGYVFQEASLFPHLTVRENLLFGSSRAGNINRGTHFSLGEIIDMFGLAGLIKRAPTALSGGERQRVAIGRALMSQPRLLLLDEPLSALDRTAREDIYPYLESLHQTLEIPCLYVSHDMTELERMADTLVLMEHGRVLASGPLSSLEADPALPLMRAPDAAVTLAGQVTDLDASYGLSHISVNGGLIIVPDPRARLGDEHRLRIKASDVSFTRARPTRTSILNCLAAKIISVNHQQADDVYVNVVAALGENGQGAHILGRVTRKSQEALALEADTPVFVQIKSVALVAR